MRVVNRQDLGAGALFASFGIADLVLARRYAFGSSSEMGPGYFPIVLGVVLITLGAVIALRALARPLAEEPRRFDVRPISILVISIVVFALLLESAGIVLSTLVLVTGCRLAAPGFRSGEVALLAAALALGAAVIFGYALSLPFPIWPVIQS